MSLQLLLLRHAKSSHKDLNLDDHSRPLNDRGRLAAEAMASYLKDHGLKPDLILSSTAERTRRTVDPIQAQWPDIRTRFVDDLYLASVPTVMDCIQRVGSSRRLMIVGHNPTMEELAVHLFDRTKDHDRAVAADLTAKFPTGALAILDFDIESWRQVAPHTAGLTNFVKPRDLE